MKISWETFAPILITAAGGLFLWLLKLLFAWIVNNIKTAIIKEVKEQLEKHEGRLINIEKSTDKNAQDVAFIIKTLIERNS